MELHDQLNSLGSGVTSYSYDKPEAGLLESFPSPFALAELNPAGAVGTLHIECPEFTCLCPMTGQPDYAKITIQYIPDKKIIESKSLKLYLWSFRNEGVFHEHVTNIMLDDLIAALQPRWCKVSAEFAARGGIGITVDAEYKK